MTKIKNIFAAIKNTDTEKKKTLIAQIGVILMLCVSPLFLTNRYLKLTISKLLFFCVVSFLLFALLNLSLASSKKLSKSDFISKDYHEIALWCFFAFGFVSFAVSDYKLEALLGSQGRFMGLITVFALVAVFLAVSRFFVPKTWVICILAAASIVVTVISCIQYVGFDPFGLYDGMSFNTRYSFISTLGNQNVYSAYLCLIVPFFMTLAIYSKNAVRKYISYCALLFGFLGMFAAKSDSTYLGIACVFIITFFVLGKNKDRLFSGIHCFLIFFVASMLIYAANNIKIFTCFKLPLPSQIMTKPVVFITGIIVCCIAILLIKLIPEATNVFSVLAKIAFLISLAAIVVVVGAFVYFSIFDKETDLGDLSEILRFNDNWGTDRGYIWKYVIKIFSDYSPIHKLFGCGEDCLYAVFKDSYGSKVASVANGTVDNAHCDYLHILVNQGLLGLSSYIAFLFFTVKKSLSIKSEFNRAALCASAAYLVQAAVNLWQPITTPLLFVFLALSVCGKDKKIPSE